MIGRSAAALKKRAQTLAAKGDDDMIELAEVLWDLRALPKPPDGDRLTLDELADLSKLSRRTVCYLIKVWETFSGLGIPRDRLVRTGWTKLAVISEICEPGEEKEALALAETCTAKNLPARLRGKGRVEEMHTVQFRLSDSQRKYLENVLVDYGAKRPKRGLENGHGLSGKNDALMRALRRLRRTSPKTLPRSSATA
jgi:hypothetical protein